MVNIYIEIRPEEKEQVIKALKKLGSEKTITTSQIAKLAGQNPNRTRFVIEALLEDGRIVRHITRMYNPKYIRYRYEVIKG